MAHGPTKHATHTHTESSIQDLTHDDTAAIHDNEGGEISALTEKASPVDADLLIIEDSAASNAKKRVQHSNARSGAGDGDHEYVAHTNDDDAVTGTPQTLASHTMSLSVDDIIEVWALVEWSWATSTQQRPFAWISISDNYDAGEADIRSFASGERGHDLLYANFWVVSTSLTYLNYDQVQTQPEANGTWAASSNDPFQQQGRITSDMTGSQTFRLEVEETSDGVTANVLYFVVFKGTA